MAPKKEKELPRGEPGVAVLLTWIMPGAGHLYLGKANFGLIAFALVGGLYLIGFKLSDGLGYEFLQADLRTRFAPALSPEIGNLGALLWHRMQRPFVQLGLNQPWPATIKLGALLTACSGIANVLLMVRAHYDARGLVPKARVSPPTAAFLTWLVPGLGHWLQGRRVRGVLIFVLLVGLFSAGCFLAQGSNLDRLRHFYYWGGQLLLGLPAILGEMIHGHARVQGEVAYAEAGVVFGCVAGMLNVLCMLDAYRGSELEEERLAAAVSAGEAS